MLRPKSFALCVGVFWSFTIFFVTLLAGFGYEQEAYRAISSLYFDWIPAGVGGAFLGAMFGMVDGLIGGYLFSQLYNYLAFREKIAVPQPD